MGSKVLLMMFLVLALALMADAATLPDTDQGLAHLGNNDHSTSCIDGNCNVEDVTATTMMMGSEINRRGLEEMPKRYISYGALMANQIPCNRRGNSYYNCQGHARANPYNRGCLVSTLCHRFTG